MPGFRRTHNSLGRKKLSALVTAYGSLLEVARRSGVTYPRLLRIVDGIEPRASDALALVALGIEVSDWSSVTEPSGTASDGG
jgi:hypothetical protein